MRRAGQWLRSRLHDDPWLGGVLVAHLAVRILLWLGGVALSTLPLTGYWQVADLQLLRDQPFETLWHLHAQPPLWNAVVAVVQQLPAWLHHPSYRTILAGAGILVVGLLFVLARRFDVRPWLAASLALAVSLSPTLVGYELFVFYTLPVAALVLATVAAVDQWDRTSAPAWLWAGVGLAATVALTRSLFHLAWVMGVALLALAWSGRRPGPRVLAAAVLPVLVVVGWYGHVASFTGEFTASTWLGMSLQKVTAAHLPADELRQLIDEGVVDPIAAVPSFQAPYHYAPYIELPEPTGVELLDRVATSNGVRNLHNLGVVAASRAYATAAGQIVDARPDVLRTQAVRATCYFLRPGHASTQVEAAYGALDRWRGFWDRVILLQPTADASRPCFASSMSGTAVALIVAPVLLGVAGLWRRLRGRHRPGDLALAVMGATVVYVTAVSTLVEVGENYRFRFLVEPIGWLALAMLVERRLPRRADLGSVTENEAVG